LGKHQVPLGDEQLLHEQAARPEEDAVALLDEFVPDRADQVCLAAARVAEGQDILGPCQEAALEENADLGIHLLWQAAPVEGFHRLLERQLGLTQQPGNPVLPAHLALLFHQVEQVALEGEPLAPGPLGFLLVAETHGGQVQCLQARREPVGQLFRSQHAPGLPPSRSAS
jgi:hypothetical protein